MDDKSQTFSEAVDEIIKTADKIQDDICNVLNIPKHL